MPRIPHVPIIVVVFMTALCPTSRSDEGVVPPSPPSVSCLGPEGESYLKDMLARIHQLQEELDAEKQARVADQEQAARKLGDRAAEQAERAAAIDEQARTRASDLAALRQECAELKAASAARENLEKRLAAAEAALEEAKEARRRAEQEAARAESAGRQDLERRLAAAEAAADEAKEARRRTEEEAGRAQSAGRQDIERRLAAAETAADEANEGRLRAEEQAAAAKRAASDEASARAQAERLVADLERRVNESAATVAGSTATTTTSRPTGAQERPAAQAPGASAGKTEAEIAAEQLAALTGKKAGRAPSERAPDASEPQVAQAPSKDDEERALRLAEDPRAERELAAKQRAALLGQSIPAAPGESPPIVAEPQAETPPPADRLAAARPRSSEARTYSVEGWVAAPGTYELEDGSTLTSAIEAAGGKLFPGQLDQVEIRHPAGGNEARNEIINAEKIVAGQSPDVPLRAGDVVRVPGSALTAVPWGVVRVVTFPIWYPISLASRGSE